MLGKAAIGDPSRSSRETVLDFIRTPFAVRCNIVKVWRPLPSELWSSLIQPSDRSRATRVECRALAAIVAMSAAILVGFAGVGLRVIDGDNMLVFPLLGKALSPTTVMTQAPGWFYAPGQSLALAGWVVGPPLAGWAFVRLLWIPTAAARPNPREAALTFAGHVASVYLYVYLMIVVGAALMVPLVGLGPQSTQTLRLCLWGFLFGESFFVPAVMWLRLVRHDASGQVFGRQRHAILALYVAVFVVIPTCGIIMAAFG